MSGGLCERVREQTRDLMRGLDIDLVDVEIKRDKGRLFLRISIDKEGGIDVEDCAKTSGLIEKVIEREKLMAEPYVLEVMSPGVDRPLRKPEDFIRNAGAGKKVRVNLHHPRGEVSTYAGILLEAGNESFTIDAGGELMEVKYASISKARLDPELPW